MSLPDVTIVGNLTADPELRTTGNGSKVVNFTIAANSNRLNKQTNQWEDGDVWFLNCNAWDGEHHMLASNIAASLRKGMTVIACGRVRQREYQAKDGSKRYVVEMTVDHIGYDLRKSAVAVNRPQQSGFNPNGGFQQQPAQQQPERQQNMWGAPSQQQTPQQAPQQAQQPAADPWASYREFGSSDWAPTSNEDDF